jgi:Pyrimidine dimer DNA glycosylase
MRLWSVHPRYLDPQGLVALWREALLARAVLRGATKGYRHHPQLERFRSHASPRYAISAYLSAVHTEASSRGYAFDRTKVGPVRSIVAIAVTRGQLEYEWEHLLRKLSVRSPAHYRKWRSLGSPECHPLFRCRAGSIEPWERIGA